MLKSSKFLILTQNGGFMKIYDFNGSKNISGKRIKEARKKLKLSQEMLAKIKMRIHELDHWRDKEETQSIISVMIRDLLWAELPETYDDIAVGNYRQQIYEYIYQTYPAA